MEERLITPIYRNVAIRGQAGSKCQIKLMISFMDGPQVDERRAGVTKQKITRDTQKNKTKKEFLIMWIGFIIPLTLLTRDYKAKNVSIGICTQVICFQPIFYWIFANHQIIKKGGLTLEGMFNLDHYSQNFDYPNFYSDFAHFFEEDGAKSKTPLHTNPSLIIHD